MKDWRTVLRLIAILPIFVALVWAIGRYCGTGGVPRRRTRWCWASSTSTTSCALRRHRGLGSRIFRFSLLVLAAAFLEHAIIFLYLYNAGGAPAWARYLHHETYYDFALHCVLAFSAMAMWSESQIDRIRDLARGTRPPAPRA